MRGGISMSIILDFNTSRWIKNQSNTTERKLKIKQEQLIKLLDYNICISLVFNDSRNIAFVKEISAIGDEINLDIIPNTIFLSKKQYILINELIDKKDIVENDFYGSSTPLLENVKSEVLIPIFKHEDSDGLSMKLIGCLYLGTTTYKEFPSKLFSQDKSINEYISDISKLFTLCSIMHERMTSAVNMIDVFMDILEHKDPYMSSHSHNVANWCREIGMKLGYSYEELYKLVLAGLLHDAGKSMIDYNILNKPDKLTEEECSIIKNHPIESYRIAKSIFNHISELKDIPNMVKYHHERYDGKGYPYGLKGEEVPFNSYIISISDALDAMMTDRPYRKAKPLNAVIRELYRNKGKQFHPKLVDIMVDRLTQAQKQFKENAFHAVSLSSLIIRLGEEVNILEGTLLEAEDYFVFKPNDIGQAEKIDLSKTTNVEMVIKDLSNLNYYEIKLEDFIDNIFYISSIKLIPSTNAFNLLWSLEGMLYLPDGVGKTSVEITRIGGDGLSFCLHNNKNLDIPYGKPIKIRVLFEELDVDITGSIVKSYNFGPYIYFDFYYTNIPDSTRDAIYRQLFRKQIQLRRAISEYK